VKPGRHNRGDHGIDLNSNSHADQSTRAMSDATRDET
jgi:hypothetical protein